MTKSRKKILSPPPSGREVAGICAALVALVFAVFGQTIGYGFVNFDDSAYIYENPIVLNGLSLSNIEWAFTHVLVGHWHPLTTIVMMLDSQLFGVWAGGHHLVNVLLHSACVVFLFLLLQEMTGALWRSAFVAAVFAIHPLRAESVAWVSECKDVLSGMFFMLTLWAYVRHVKSKGSYAMVLLWFALGLLSKPMLVTVPCVLLLLDYWPLNRLRTYPQFLTLLREKIPLFALSALSSLATVFALKSGKEPTSTYPANLPVSYAVYLSKLFYPAHLAALYPLPQNGWPLWQVFNAILLLAALSAGAWLLRRKQPYLLTGWLWYLGMLLPVAGVLQVGDQAYADRYTYLPQIGVCIAGTWMAADWAGLRRNRRAALAGVAGVILCALLAAGWHQVTYWRDGAILWSHTVEYTQDNFIAYDSLGEAVAEQGHMDAAIADYREVLRIKPTYEKAYNNLGYTLFQEGRVSDAIAEYREALRINPSFSEAHNNLGYALFQTGHIEEAIAEFREALRINPFYVEALNNLGDALSRQGHLDEAMTQFREASRIDPRDANARNNLGNALLQQGNIDEAIVEYREALRMNPALVATEINLGNALFRQEASEQEGIGQLQKALELRPGDVSVQTNLAWMLATARQQTLRNGATALELAAGANRTTRGTNPMVLRTLAAAYAETNDFANALQTAHNALQLAETGSNTALVGALSREISLYETRHRFEDAH